MFPPIPMKSPGVDGIPPKLLLDIVEQIGIPLAGVLKFADGTQVFRTIISDADRQQLQDYLNKFTEGLRSG